jgi:hypothetical protein
MGTFQMPPFTIPNLNKEEKRVPISTVVLSGQREAVSDAVFNVKQKVDATSSDPLVSNGQRLVPSVTRVFSKSRDLYVYLQAYEHDATTPEPMVAYVSLFQNQERAFQSAPLAVVEQNLSRSKAVPLRFDLPLSAIAPGHYDCQVTVLDTTGQKAAFWQAPIVIVP